MIVKKLESMALEVAISPWIRFVPFGRPALNLRPDINDENDASYIVARGDGNTNNDDYSWYLWNPNTPNPEDYQIFKGFKYNNKCLQYNDKDEIEFAKCNGSDYQLFYFQYFNRDTKPVLWIPKSDKVAVSFENKYVRIKNYEGECIKASNNIDGYAQYTKCDDKDDWQNFLLKKVDDTYYQIIQRPFDVSLAPIDDFPITGGKIGPVDLRKKKQLCKNY